MGKAIKHTITLLCPQAVPTVWRDIEPLLSQCVIMSPEIESVDAYYSILQSGFTGAFLVMEEEKLVGLALIQRVEYASLAICRVRAIVGERIPLWIDLLNEAVYNWAALNDCQQVQAYGRASWKGSYKEQGWKMDKIIYSKPVISTLH